MHRPLLAVMSLRRFLMPAAACVFLAYATAGQAQYVGTYAGAYAGDEYGSWSEAGGATLQ